jgi:drug/metabolite transporter (DMT)-like permease
VVEEDPLPLSTFGPTFQVISTIYLSGVTTALANWILAKAQRDISAERALVIYAVDPVYGAAFSYLLVGETLGGVPGWIGAGLITWQQLRMPLLCIRFQV